MGSFAEKLSAGLVVESEIARWLRRRGNAILPVYETEQEYKGPRFFVPSDVIAGGELVAPDMLAFREGKAFWVEAKGKSAFTWHRNSQRWTTGIDLHHYEHYLRVRSATGIPLFLFFLHREGNAAKDSPLGCPSGLYMGEIVELSRRINHSHQNHGKNGMVYWWEKKLRKMAAIEDFQNHDQWIKDCFGEE